MLVRLTRLTFLATLGLAIALSQGPDTSAQTFAELLQLPPNPDPIQPAATAEQAGAEPGNAKKRSSADSDSDPFQEEVQKGDEAKQDSETKDSTTESTSDEASGNDTDKSSAGGTEDSRADNKQEDSDSTPDVEEEGGDAEGEEEDVFDSDDFRISTFEGQTPVAGGYQFGERITLDLTKGSSFGDSAPRRMDEAGSDVSDLPITRALENSLSESASIGEMKLISSIDTGAFLQDSSSVVSVTTQRRSPVSQNPYIRGYRNGQIYSQADGAYFSPVRIDLDTLTSKIDPGLINTIEVIPGPYGLRYGPGFSFINVQLIDTPRYDQPEHHLISALNTRLNGGQFSVRETAYGGGRRNGYIASLSFRTGSDYSPGGDAPIEQVPSSYKTMNGFLKYGWDLSPETRLELQYSRYDEFDSEYAAQFFDVDHLSTDAATVSYIIDDPYEHVKKQFDVWFNYTGFDGDTLGAGKRAPFSVIDRVENALGAGSNFEAFATGRLATTGSRITQTSGKDGEVKITKGTDFRYVGQELRETFSATNAGLNSFADKQTNMPGAYQINPGLFVELEKPWKKLPRLTTKLGGRVDYVRTDANEAELRRDPTGNLETSLNNFDQLEQDDVLWAAYMIQEARICDQLTLTLSGGHSERTPDLIDRYADGIFLGIMQSGFNRVIGEPTLKKEQLWQVDTGVDIDLENARGSAKYFYSFIEDYNLYQGALVSDPTGARLLRATNADLVTLTGFELDGIWDPSRSISLFGNSRYLVGDDLNIELQNGSELDQPLYGISPFEGTVGIRWHDRCNGETWGIEIAARMVSSQDRLAGLRLGSTSVNSLGPLEEATSGFTVFNLRAYYNYSESLRLTGGIENLFDRTYQEHLDLRLPEDAANGFSATRVLRPGITPYFGLEWIL